jgi:hypothetical protein
MTNPSLSLSSHTAWQAFVELSESNPRISTYFDQYGEYAAEAAMPLMFEMMERVWDSVPQTVQQDMIVYGRPHHYILDQFDFSAKTVTLKDSVMAAACEIIDVHSRSVSLRRALWGERKAVAAT